ncbi:retrovirus-related pol polyprotein from transposon TNT 1-94 [Tanacetum coccineum]
MKAYRRCIELLSDYDCDIRIKREKHMSLMIALSRKERDTTIKSSSLNDKLTKKELKQVEADDQVIQTILLGLPEDIYAAIDTCETAQEIRFTSTDGESIKSYYHRFSKLMNDFKRNKHFPEKIAIQSKEVNKLRAERLRKTHDPLALMANSSNPYNFPVFHQDQPSPSTHTQQRLPNNNIIPQPSLNQNYMQQPMTNPEDITDPTTVMNMTLALIDKAFKLNYSTPTNNNQRISSNLCNRQIAQPGMNIGQDRQMQMVRGNGGNQFRQYAGQDNPNGNGNVVAALSEGNDIRNNEAGIQLQAEEFDLMDVVGDLDEIEEVNYNTLCFQVIDVVNEFTMYLLYDQHRSWRIPSEDLYEEAPVMLEQAPRSLYSAASAAIQPDPLTLEMFHSLHIHHDAQRSAAVKRVEVIEKKRLLTINRVFRTRQDQGQPQLLANAHTTLNSCNVNLWTFKGTEGVVGLTRWFEKMESVFSISTAQPKSRSNLRLALYKADALTWWNAHVKTTTPVLAHAMPWQRRTEGNVLLTTTTTTEKQYNTTNRNNNNNNRNSNNNNQQGNGCFECGDQGHFKRNCPRLRNNDRGNQAGNDRAPAKVYVVGNAGANPDNVVAGTFLLNNRYAYILFDTGADRSFVSTAFSSQIDITPSTLDHYYDVELADGRIIGLNTILKGSH